MMIRSKYYRIFLKLEHLKLKIMFKFLKRLFSKKEPRLCVKDIKPGEIIKIEWSRISTGIGDVTCVANDTKTKKILIRVRWNNYKEVKCDEYEDKILSYKGKELKNFHLLNIESRSPIVEVDKLDDLRKELEKCIGDEDYEKASIIQKKIDKILGKQI